MSHNTPPDWVRCVNCCHWRGSRSLISYGTAVQWDNGPGKCLGGHGGSTQGDYSCHRWKQWNVLKGKNGNQKTFDF